MCVLLIALVKHLHKHKVSYRETTATQPCTARDRVTRNTSHTAMHHFLHMYSATTTDTPNYLCTYVTSAVLQMAKTEIQVPPLNYVCLTSS